MLTDLAIRNAKPREKPFKLSDAGGLHLLVNPNGSRLWRFAYRYGGKQKQLALGGYPATTLAGAREKRDTAKPILREGADPSVQARLDRITRRIAEAQTFDLIADEFVAKMEREQRATSTVAKTKWLLDFARSDLGERPIAEISAAEVLAVLRKVEVRGRLESARRLRSTIGGVFRLAISTARAENDPTFALTAPQVTHRAAIVEPRGFGALLRAVWGYEGQPATHAALKLAALLFPRPGELRTAEWSEFDLGADRLVCRPAKHDG